MLVQKNLVSLLERACLRHAPTRHGIMTTHAQHEATGEKYLDRSRKPTRRQLEEHLKGTLTLAVPAARHNSSAMIILDVDAEAFERVPLLIEAAHQHGLWAWGEIHEERNRGYCYVPFADLVNAEQLKQLGDLLISDAGLSHIPASLLDNRTMNQAITRLPFGVHTWTQTRGLVIFANGDSYDLNTDLDAGLRAWSERYSENQPPAPHQPEPASQNAPARPRATKQPQHDQTYDYTAADIQRMYNERHDVCDILAAHGGRRGSRNNWHCPCGNHKSSKDRHGSLQIKAARNPKYGAHIVQGFSADCLFFSDPHKTYDAFNVYAALNGLSNTDMLKYARTDLGLHHQPKRTNEPPTSNEPESDHHQRRRAERPAAPVAPVVDVAATRRHALDVFMADDDLSNSARRVYRFLFNFTQGITCRPSIARIAYETAMHERTAQRAIRQLEQRGHITTDHRENHRGDQTSIYQFRLLVASSPPDIKLNTCTKPTLVKACKGGATTPAPTSQPEPHILPHDQEPETTPIGVLPDPMREPAAAPLRGVRPRKQIRFVEDLANNRPAPQTPELPPPPAMPEPDHAEPQGATFTPVPDGYYFDPDTLELKKCPIIADQDRMETPSFEGNVNGLAVMRDVVQKLRTAAIAEKSGAAWARYHREAKRLAMIEQCYLARATTQHAPPLHAETVNSSDGGQKRRTRRGTQRRFL